MLVSVLKNIISHFSSVCLGLTTGGMVTKGDGVAFLGQSQIGLLLSFCRSSAALPLKISICSSEVLAVLANHK